MEDQHDESGDIVDTTDDDEVDDKDNNEDSNDNDNDNDESSDCDYDDDDDDDDDDNRHLPFSNRRLSPWVSCHERPVCEAGWREIL